MYQTSSGGCGKHFFSDSNVHAHQEEIEAAVLDGELTSTAVAEKLLEPYRSSE